MTDNKTNRWIFLESLDSERRLLVERIRDAFKGVELEDGIGVQEACALDDYEPTAELRKADERHDWTALLSVFLASDFAGSLTVPVPFMDAKGKRFCFPCFLIEGLVSDDYFWIDTCFFTDMGKAGEGGEYLDFLEIMTPEQLKVIEYFFNLRLKRYADKSCVNDDGAENVRSVFQNWVSAHRSVL